MKSGRRTSVFQGFVHPHLPRTHLQAAVTRALQRSRVVALLGPRQAGKTTLARTFLASGDPAYFDLEHPVSVSRLENPMVRRLLVIGYWLLGKVGRLEGWKVGRSAAKFWRLSGPVARWPGTSTLQNGSRPTANCQLPTANCQLPTANCDPGQILTNSATPSHLILLTAGSTSFPSVLR